MPSLLHIIGSQPFFEGLCEPYLQMLVDHAMQTLFVPGQVIFREGDPANRFYLIRQGRVIVELKRQEGRSISIQTLGPGRELGWSWILPPHLEYFTARALEPTEAIFFYGTRLRAQCEENHDLGFEMIKRMAEVMSHRIEGVRQRLLEFHVNAFDHPCQATVL